MIAQLLSRLAAMGVSVAVEGTDLVVVPGSLLADDDVALLRDRKAEILAHLASPRSIFGPCPSCGAVAWEPRVIPLLCRGCGYQEPSRFTGKGTPRWPGVR